MTCNFCINDFEGPLDLLLHLIRSSKMNIYEINIESITKQYLDFISNIEDLNVDNASEYLVMSAELIRLKSRLLIKKDEEETNEDNEYEFNSEEDLKNKLLEYERIKNVTSSFKELENMRSEYYTKIPSNLSEFKDETFNTNIDVNLEDLINSFELFLKRQKLNKPLNTKITKKELSVSERTSQIRNILKKNKKCTFTSLFTQVTRPFIVVTFLSILEMAKNKELAITQDKSFGDIMLEMK